MLLQELKELIEYSPQDGSFFVLKNNSRVRQIFPDEEGYLVFFRNKKKYKLKASRVAYEIGFGAITRKDQFVLHKNLDFEDYRLINLKLISKVIYLKIREAQKNLSGALKLTPHPNDAFAYVLHWRENGKDKTLVVQDIVPARKKLTQLQLKYAKILSSYCLFDI